MRLVRLAPLVVFLPFLSFVLTGSQVPTVHIEDTEIWSACMAEVSTCNSLSMDSQSSIITGTLPTTLGLFTALKQMWIRSPSLTGSVPTELGSLTGIEFLYNPCSSFNFPAADLVFFNVHRCAVV
mmetsp:Transcript_16930/g.32767  ORF Transcript_16930/g.32767 Transcript_16930/m.32767 type:complete len:125 (+) Transcript_16930:235-609(+)